MTIILIIFCISCAISFISGVLLERKKKANSPILTLVGFISFILSICSLICFIIGHYITSPL